MPGVQHSQHKGVVDTAGRTLCAVPNGNDELLDPCRKNNIATSRTSQARHISCTLETANHYYGTSWPCGLIIPARSDCALRFQGLSRTRNRPAKNYPPSWLRHIHQRPKKWRNRSGQAGGGTFVPSSLFRQRLTACLAAMRSQASRIHPEANDD